jgi:quinol monooxygenase YgiN
VLLVCSFTVPEDQTPEFTASANRATELLTAQPGCSRAVLARSADTPDKWVLTVEFTTVVAGQCRRSKFAST